jgi:hypothetical protein
MRSFILLIGAAGFGAAGCSKGASVGDYKPSVDNSRKALEAALTRWKAGENPGLIPGSPAVEVADAKWKARQKLVDFEILSEEPQSDGPRVFKVRLVMAKSPPIETRYFVFGIEPISVYREEDYKQLGAMGK